jgi:hypothetical protein
VQYCFDIQSQFGGHWIERWTKEAHAAHASLFRGTLASNVLSLIRSEAQ